MDKEITATWARKTALEIKGAKVKSELIKCGAAIRTAVKENRLSANVNMYADKLTISELKGRGFVVTQQDTQRDGSWIIINW